LALQEGNIPVITAFLGRLRLFAEIGVYTQETGGTAGIYMLCTSYVNEKYCKQRPVMITVCSKSIK
jgi:hypothetical protein